MKKPDKAFGVSSAEDSSGFLLWQVTTNWQRGIKKLLDAIDLTHPQFVVLASLLWLSKKQEAVTQIHLSNHNKIDPMTTSAIIKILLRKEFIERREHHSDTRAKAITLTEEGTKITRKAVKMIEKFDEHFFETLGDRQDNFNKNLLTLLQKEEN